MKANVFLLATLIGLATASADITAHARMIKKSGSKVTGTVDFKDIDGDSVQVKYNLKNLPKNTTLGMHIHEMPNCNSKDGSSAGRHYAKMEEIGGTSSNNQGHYAGDLLSITSDSAGRARGSFVAQHLTITETNAISKRSLVIHEGPDDINYPSSARIACGIIEGPPVKISTEKHSSTNH
jgi:superoxide dismutase, Cu-Zn family